MSRRAWTRQLAPAAAPERDLQRDAEAWLKGLVDVGLVRAWYHRPDLKPKRSEKAGLPDLIIALPGDVVAVELKTAKGKVTLEQAIWLASFRRSAVCRSLAEFQSQLRAWGVG